MRTTLCIALSWNLACVGTDTEISLTALRSSGESRIPESLRKDGFMIVNNSIDAKKISLLAISLNDCLESGAGGDEVFVERQTFNGAPRTTLGLRSRETFDGCGDLTRTLIGYYQSQTQLIGEAIAKILDTPMNVSSDKESLSAMIEDANSGSLDHFRLYGSNSEGQQESDSVSLPFHYDMGLFLIVTPEVWLGGDSKRQRSELVVKRADGSQIYIEPSDPNSVIVLIGRGLTHWLSPDIDLSPCLHAVIPQKVGARGAKRVVLGRMFLPPMEQESPDGVKFSDFFLAPLNEKEADDSNHVQWRRLTELECAAGSKACWMQCMPDIDCGVTESVCRDIGNHRNCDPNECDCTLMCPDPPATLLPSTRPAHVASFKRVSVGSRHPPSSEDTVPVPVVGVVQPPNGSKRFCYGATSMVMSGFQSVTSDKVYCIILFFQPWLLDTPLKFAIGCLGVFLLGLIIESAIKFRRYVTNDVSFSKNWIREIAVTSLFGLNVLLGYLAMLAAMTFNVEIFISTVVGVAIGHLVFGNSKQPVRETADPCCVTSEAPVQQTGLVNSTGACCCDR